MKGSPVFLVFLTLMLLSQLSTRAQSHQIIDAGECLGKVYTADEVARRAKITEMPSLNVTPEALAHDVHGTIVIQAILCRNGRVTDIQAIKELPFGLTQRAIAAVSNLKFTPAEFNWHTVSQRQKFEFRINESGVSEIDSAAAAGRLVEELDIMGNRRITKEQLLPLIKTRAGDIYNSDQVHKDLMAILATGLFNAMSTRVTIDDAVRGGVRVIFEVMELPLITEIKIEGLKAGDESAVLNELVKQRVNLTVGRPLDLAGLRKATFVIEQFFQAQGWANAKAEALVESISGTQVKVILKIGGRDF